MKLKFFLGGLLLIGITTLTLTSFNLKSENMEKKKEPGYTFLSISTAKPGKLDDLIRIGSEPSEKMEKKVEGLIARQVGVDRERNSVMVWVTFDTKETLYDYLETDAGKSDHGDQEEMDAIIETFTMYDITPMSQSFEMK